MREAAMSAPVRCTRRCDNREQKTTSRGRKLLWEVFLLCEAAAAGHRKQRIKQETNSKNGLRPQR